MLRVAITLVLLAGSAGAQWMTQDSRTKESLRGLSVVNEKLVWASGTHGTYVVTRNGGKTWEAAHVPGAENLDFRDVQAFGDVVYLLAAGPGEQSRIYKSEDGGAHWELQLTNKDPKGFFDCMAFWDENHGIVIGDPTKGSFEVVTTEDGGRTWESRDRGKMPTALEGEGAFAASGTCVAVEGKKNAWFATGGAVARVFHTSDRGRNWNAVETPIQHGAPSAGIFSIAFQDAKHGVIAGGDYQHPEKGGVNLATTNDGGATWKPVTMKDQRYFSAIAFVGEGLVAVGSGASAYSEAGLELWNWSTDQGFNTVGTDARKGPVWAVGADGRIARADLRR